jgi:hypothetical protein
LKKQTAQNRIVNWGRRSKFITTLSKSIWVHRKAKKSAPKTTTRQQSVIKASLKHPWRKTFSMQNRSTNVWWMTSPISRLTAMSGNSNVIMSEDHPAAEDVKFIRKTKFPAKVLLWLAVIESETVFFKAGLAVNKEVYSFKCLPVLHLTWFGICTLRKGYVGLIRRTKNLILPKGRKSNKRPTYTADQKILGELEREGLQQQLSSKSCKVLDDKDQKRAEVHWNYGNS